jgi:hypothetical protein
MSANGNGHAVAAEMTMVEGLRTTLQVAVRALADVHALSAYIRELEWRVKTLEVNQGQPPMTLQEHN